MSKRRRNSSSSSSSENSGEVSLDASFLDETPSSPFALSQTSLVDIGIEDTVSVSEYDAISSEQPTTTENNPTNFKGLIQPEISLNESSLKSFDIDVSDEQDELVENIISGQPEANSKGPSEGTRCDDTEEDNTENEGDCDLDFDDALSIDSIDDDLLSSDPLESSNPNQSADKPIYKDAPINISESLLAVLSFSVRHNLDGKAIVDLLKLISLHLKEEDNEFKSTLYFFKKHFSHLKAPVKLHYFCSVCLACLPTCDSVCPNINSHKNKKTQCSYFLEISLVHQLQMLYKRKGILENILSRFSREKQHSQNIEDIYDGQIYKEFVESGFLSEKNKYNISLTWNSDGVPVFKSPKTSMWPMYLVINELPFKMRFKKSNVLLGGIWYGAKPSANMLLRPFIDSLTTLRKGIEVKPFDISPETTILVQVILVAGTADLPAKAEFMGIKYPSGSHSCAVCKISGKSVKVKPTATLEKATKSPRGSADEDTPSEGEDDEPRKTKGPVLEKKERVASVWVFPYAEEEAELRRHEETENFGNAVYPQRKKNHSAHIFGVKYPTFLSKMMPDMIRGMGIDDLHHAYHGVGHKLVELWTLPRYKKMPWSIQGKIAVLDERLQNIKLPNYIQCGVRTLSNLSLWKAQHMKVFILYLALPVLEGVLPTVYYNHFSIFVNCIYILNSSSISPDQLLFCTVQLKSFVKQFQDLYGERHMTMNVHNTLHLTFVVNNLGPLRCYSCFPFESLNGEMLKMIHGTKYVQIQLANCAYMLMSLPYEISCVHSQKLSEFTHNIHHSYQKVRMLEQISSETFAAGNYIDLQNVSAEVITSMTDAGLNVKFCKFFTKLKKGALLFVAKSYTRSTKTASYLISYKEATGIQYGKILQFIKVSCLPSCVQNCTCHPSYIAAVQNIVTRTFSDFSNVKSIRHMLRYLNQDTISFVNVSQLTHICLSVNISGKDPILCERVNWLEME